jgi:hypothetical protein
VTAIIAMSIGWGTRFSRLAEQHAIKTTRPKPKIETVWIRDIIVVVSTVTPTQRATQGLALVDKASI